ncbi:50S ribosomal protein L30 [Sulfolobales archaeon HS-7]|nr:50S ribosomal protein L30 [Sulfolobales archaeon HS-7]
MVLIATIRVRGTVGIPHDIENTLIRLRLLRKYSAMVYPDKKEIMGMIKYVSGYITWGEVNEEALSKLLLRARMKDNSRFNAESLQKVLGMSHEELIDNLIQGKVYLHKLNNAFRLPIGLRPPKYGFSGKINIPFNAGGETGYRGNAINDLILSMT